jgi:hypothetical protein
MNRIDIINGFVKKLKATKYLEIGVQSGDCFRAINCENKVGVDPDGLSAATIIKTSDDFFIENKEKFKVIFIDGMHESDFVYRDIMNSLNCLEEGGIVLMHDCLPTNESMQTIPLQSHHVEWTGNTWEAYVKVRTERDDLEMRVVNCDWGVGIIRKLRDDEPRAQKLVLNCEANYANFVNNKQEWMNIINPQTLTDFFNS